MSHKIRHPLWPGEVRALLSACETPRERLVILALLETGITAGELSELKASQINWRNRILRRPGSGPASHLSNELAQLLRTHFDSATTLGIGNRQIQRIVRAVGKRAGLTSLITPDVLRRTGLEDPLAAGNVSDTPGRILMEAADAAADIILVADDDRKYVDLNQAAAKALGLPKRDIIGRSIDDFFSEAKEEMIPSAWRAFIADGEQTGLCRLRHQDRLFEYRARANFVPGLHVSVLRPVDLDQRI
jgi:PAS domain-containing protein